MRNTSHHITSHHNTTQKTTMRNTSHHITRYYNTSQHNTSQHNTDNNAKYITSHHNTTQYITSQHMTTMRNTSHHNTMIVMQMCVCVNALSDFLRSRPNRVTSAAWRAAANLKTPALILSHRPGPVGSRVDALDDEDHDHSDAHLAASYCACSTRSERGHCQYGNTWRGSAGS